MCCSAAVKMFLSGSTPVQGTGDKPVQRLRFSVWFFSVVDRHKIFLSGPWGWWLVIRQHVINEKTIDISSNPEDILQSTDCHAQSLLSQGKNTTTQHASSLHTSLVRVDLFIRGLVHSGPMAEVSNFKNNTTVVYTVCFKPWYKSVKADFVHKGFSPQWPNGRSFKL